MLAVSLSTAPAAAQDGEPYQDSPPDAHYWEALNTLVRDGVFEGTDCEDGFCPDEPLDRATMAVWTVRFLDDADPSPVTSTRFADVDASHRRAAFIERLAELGITAGCRDGAVFCPDGTVSRAQMAVLLSRAFGLPERPGQGFDDVPADAWHAPHVAGLVASGIVRVCAVDPDRYCPDDAVTRGQMAVLLARAFGVVGTGPGGYKPPDTVNADLHLVQIDKIQGNLAPKSVVASGTGLYFAQNMMYRHTISVFDHQKNLVKTIEDSVDLKSFGFDVPGDSYRGAPVEAAFTSDGSRAFVSNYRMYGRGYDPAAGGDSCGNDQGQDSFVYRIDTASLEIDAVYPVGPVPKYLAVTPDDRLLLVANWCGFDVTVIDLQTGETVAQIEVGRHPRGIAIAPDGRSAYVAVMGERRVAVLDIPSRSAADDQAAAEITLRAYLEDMGAGPRHLVLSPDGAVLYVTLNGENALIAVDVSTGREIGRVHTGVQPRSMDISDDGTALYVVNYRSNTMTKVRTADMKTTQQFQTAPRPIGITYDPFNNEVWVSTYSGVIHVFAERPP